MVKKYFKSIFVLLPLLAMYSCGDIFTNNDEGAGRDGFTQFAVCDLDVDAFSYILERDISQEITCLKENLDLFIKIVKTDKPCLLYTSPSPRD